MRLGCGSSASDTPLTSELAPKHHDGSGNAETGVCSYHNSHHHSKREAAKNLAAHEEKHEDGEERETAGKNGTRKSLIDGLVDDGLEGHEPEIFAHAVEDNDRIVH